MDHDVLCQTIYSRTANKKQKTKHWAQLRSSLLCRVYKLHRNYLFDERYRQKLALMREKIEQRHAVRCVLHCRLQSSMPEYVESLYKMRFLQQ